MVFQAKKLFLSCISDSKKKKSFMIKRLLIRNYAIIENLEMDFSRGLTIITGETGAGKSILLGALGLVMGKRADTKSLYNENEKCFVEGIFDIGKYDLQAFFEEHDLDYDQELTVRREINPNGKSRSFINDTPVNLKMLQALSAELIDLHQQFDTLDLNQLSFQLKMLDALAGNKPKLKTYLGEYRIYLANKKQLATLIENDRQAKKESDFINFQFQELEEAALEVEEQSDLEATLNVLNNAEQIKRTLGASYQALSENEQSLIAQLETISHDLSQLKDFNKDLNTLYERFAGILIELEDLGRSFEDQADEVEFNPERVEEVQSRLDLIYRLQTKHNVQSISELLDIHEQLQSQIDGHSTLSAEINSLRKVIEQQEAHLIELAKELSERRKSVLAPFEKKVRKRLASLAMEHAQLKVEINVLKDLGPSGWDEVRFLFAANKGSRLQEIRDVASGGELSRLALVIKSLVASAIPLPTLIFDEIDTGISGDIALKMGTILRKLSDEHQVVSITHSPQIASKSDTHYFVFKEVLKDRTLTKVRRLKADEQVRAIAVMLSQNPPSNAALENAKELINQK